MKRKFDAILRYFTKESRRKELINLYERTKFELPFYLNELALYKFVVEQTSKTLSERDYYNKKHTEVLCICFKKINDLDNYSCDLGMTNNEDVALFFKQYEASKTIRMGNPKSYYIQLNDN